MSDFTSSSTSDLVLDLVLLVGVSTEPFDADELALVLLAGLSVTAALGFWGVPPSAFTAAAVIPDRPRVRERVARVEEMEEAMEASSSDWDLIRAERRRVSMVSVVPGASPCCFCMVACVDVWWREKVDGSPLSRFPITCVR